MVTAFPPSHRNVNVINISVKVTGTQGQTGVNFCNTLPGRVRSVVKSLAAHGVTPGFTLVKVNNERFDKALHHHDPAAPNLHVGRKLSASQVPFTLHFRRHALLPTSTHTTWRVFFDGGARRNDDLAGVRFVVLHSTKESPFQSCFWRKGHRPGTGTWSARTPIVYQSPFITTPTTWRRSTRRRYRRPI